MNRREALASLLALPALKGSSVSTVAIRPRDTIILECPASLSHEQAMTIKTKLKDLFPDNLVLVITDGMKFRTVHVVHKER